MKGFFERNARNYDFSDFNFGHVDNKEWTHFTEMRSWLKKQDFSQWHRPHAWTFTFQYDQSLDSAKKNMRHFLNVLNKKVYGNASQRFDKKLKCIPVIESDIDKRLHYHLIIEHLSRGNMRQETYHLLIGSLWKYGRVQSNGVFDYSEDSAWLDYILKSETKELGTKDLSIDIENMSL